jgi:hypothetical protein
MNVNDQFPSVPREPLDVSLSTASIVEPPSQEPGDHSCTCDTANQASMEQFIYSIGKIGCASNNCGINGNIMPPPGAIR